MTGILICKRPIGSKKWDRYPETINFEDGHVIEIWVEKLLDGGKIIFLTHDRYGNHQAIIRDPEIWRETGDATLSDTHLPADTVTVFRISSGETEYSISHPAPERRR